MVANSQNRLFAEGDQTAYNIKIEAFEGPLDLLLHLIKKSEVDICNIPIATVTRQYLEYIELMKELNLDIAGDFLVMASTLIQIKSKMLLPASNDDEAVEEDEEDPRAELVRRLLEYQKYKEAAMTLGGRELLGRDTFARKFEAPELKSLQPEEESLEIELFELIEAFRRVLAKVPVQSFHEVGAESISIADRINDILTLLQGKEAVTFDELFAEGGTRELLIASFLAILELCKLKMVKVVQAASFGTILIMPAVPEGEEGLTEDAVGPGRY
ncbi:MAG: segregation and condensation protein [Geobacteraceae bacterium]|nr:MAG: segregation and condensation protein [Geobacteraceae bacterium]